MNILLKKGYVRRKPSRPERMAIFMDKTAFFAIDIQNYFFDSKSPAYIKSSKDILIRVNNMLKYFELRESTIIFTLFNSPARKNNLMRKWWNRMPEGNQCEIFPKIYIPKKHYMFYKEDYSCFRHSRIKKILKESRVERIYFSGVMTHLCVESSARDSFQEGYETFILEDCCDSNKRKYHNNSIENMRHGFAEIVTSSDILK